VQCLHLYFYLVFSGVSAKTEREISEDDGKGLSQATELDGDESFTDDDKIPSLPRNDILTPATSQTSASVSALPHCVPK
jgi:hypothetical protein